MHSMPDAQKETVFFDGWGLGFGFGFQNVLPFIN
jgi:hypothetical protein